MTEPLKEAYRNVRFRCPKSDPPPAFFIITAHNPDGITAEDSANHEADAALKFELTRRGHEFFPVTGGSPDFSHAEPGYGVVCARVEALRLAQMFRQEAVFEVRGGRVSLVRCPGRGDWAVARIGDLWGTAYLISPWPCFRTGCGVAPSICRAT
jgi:hypothetical protein